MRPPATVFLSLRKYFVWAKDLAKDFNMRPPRKIKVGFAKDSRKLFVFIRALIHIYIHINTHDEYHIFGEKHCFSPWLYLHNSRRQERDATKQLIFILMTRGLHQLTSEMRVLFAMQTLVAVRR